MAWSAGYMKLPFRASNTTDFISFKVWKCQSKDIMESEDKVNLFRKREAASVAVHYT